MALALVAPVQETSLIIPAIAIPPPMAAGTAAARVTIPQVVPASGLNRLRSRMEDSFTFFDTPKKRGSTCRNGFKAYNVKFITAEIKTYVCIGKVTCLSR